MTRILTLCACGFLCVACVTGCGTSTTPTVSAPPTTPVVVSDKPTVPKNYNGTSEPDPADAGAHSADGAGN